MWVDPADGYNDRSHVVRMARRIKRAGMRLLIDFHYSDSWTDPGQQYPPAAWQGLDAAGLTAKVAEHTTSVLTALARAGVTADYVQIGNEINPGMLWPLGQTWDVDPTDDVTDPQWDNLAAFLTAGARAAKAVHRRTKVLLHLTNVNNGIGSLTWWFDEIIARDVPFDMIGLSFYGYWHGSFADIQNAITVLSDRYDREVMVVETAYPWTLADNPTVPWENVIDQEAELVAGYPATPAGQAAYIRGLQDVVAGGARRPRARHRVVGARMDRRPRFRLGPYRSRIGQCLGEPGGVRLERSAAARAGDVRPGPLTDAPEQPARRADRARPRTTQSTPGASPVEPRHRAACWRAGPQRRRHVGAVQVGAQKSGKERVARAVGVHNLRNRHGRHLE